MQSRLESLIEQLLNIGSGFVVSLLLWSYVVVPLWGIQVSRQDNLAITALFTAASIIRGYVWRRLFNHMTWRKHAASRDQAR